MARDFIGNSVSVGTGIKVFFYIDPQYLNGTTTGMAFEVGIMNDIMFETNRDVAPQFISGDRNAISYCSGKRLTSGKISFSVIERDFIDFFVNEFLKGDAVKDLLTNADFNTNRFGVETDVNKPSSFLNLNSEIKYLDQLPPVDIVLVGSAEIVNSMSNVNSFSLANDPANYGNNSTSEVREIFKIGDNFRMDATLFMKLENVKFLNDSFGISAGSALKDQVLDFIVCGQRHPWKEAEYSKVIDVRTGG